MPLCQIDMILHFRIRHLILNTPPQNLIPIILYKKKQLRQQPIHLTLPQNPILIHHIRIQQQALLQLPNLNLPRPIRIHKPLKPLHIHILKPPYPTPFPPKPYRQLKNIQTPTPIPINLPHNPLHSHIPIHKPPIKPPQYPQIQYLPNTVPIIQKFIMLFLSQNAYKLLNTDSPAAITVHCIPDYLNLPWIEGKVECWVD